MSQAESEPQPSLSIYIWSTHGGLMVRTCGTHRGSAGPDPEKSRKKFRRRLVDGADFDRYPRVDYDGTWEGGAVRQGASGQTGCFCRHRSLL